MKHFFLAIAITTATFSTVYRSWAQTEPTSKCTKNHIILLINVESYGCTAKFDTDGQLIGGFNEEELAKKFTRVKSAAGIVNFISGQGFKVISFSPIQSGLSRGNGGGFEGYTVLFESISTTTSK